MNITVKSAIINGEVYKNLSSPKTEDKVYTVNGRTYTSLEALRQALGVSDVFLNKALKSGVNLDCLWHFVKGTSDIEVSKGVCTKLGIDYRVVLSTEDNNQIVLIGLNALSEFSGVSKAELVERFNANWAVDAILTVPTTQPIEHNNRAVQTSNISTAITTSNKSFKLIYKGEEYRSITNFCNKFGLQRFSVDECLKHTDDLDDWLQAKIDRRTKRLEKSKQAS